VYDRSDGNHHHIRHSHAHRVIRYLQYWRVEEDNYLARMLNLSWMGQRELDERPSASGVEVGPRMNDGYLCARTTFDEPQGGMYAALCILKGRI
jgi:hypothetical protein